MQQTPAAVIFEAGEADFQATVLDRSHEVPVVVDFWAAWCAPCRALGPVLERLANEGGGSWLLAKVDVDANPRLAAAAGVQGIPAVRAFSGGKQVAEFTGALPEPQVRAWLDKLGPSPADSEVASGEEAEMDGRLEDAAEAYRRALSLDPAVEAARRGLARVELAQRVESSAGAGDDPLAAADLDVAQGRVEEAFERLLTVVRGADGEAGAKARIRLLSLFDALGPDDPRVTHARRELNRALF